MKRAFLGILAVAALVFARPAGGEDVSGWQGAKWGMTSDQVQKVLNYPTLVADLASVCGEKCDGSAPISWFGSWAFRLYLATAVNHSYIKLKWDESDDYCL